MDEFEKNLFGSGDDSAPLDEAESKKNDTSNEGYLFENDGSDTPEETSSDVFTFDKNGEYHFTSSMKDENVYSNSEDNTSEEAASADKPEYENLHTENTQSARQNPYRNPYQQNGYSQNAGYSQTAYRDAYRNSPYNTEPPKPSNGSSTGKRIVFAILAVVIILAAVGIGISIGKFKNPSSNGNAVTNDAATSGDSATMATEATQNATQQTENNASSGIAVAKQSRGSVVGVVVYDISGNLHGEGSGVVMGLNDSKNATYIITCAHVVSDKDIKSCGIMLENGKVEPATIVGFDERTDIGVLKVSKTNLRAAVFGDSTALQVGEIVYAIGNPGGSEFYGSMTSGIVSALDRSISSTYNMTVIQHDAAISPGNSGGALVNSSGQVVGINSSKISATDYEGIGFAVPISVAHPVVESLIKYGYVPNRPKLGISYASVSNYWRYSAIVQSKGLPAGSVIIASISDDSSFKGTEVAVGDMITSVNGKKLSKPDVLLDVIEKSNVGDSLKLGICRIERTSGVGGSYKVNQFDVTVKLVEDKGSSATPDKEEETTQSFYDYYYGDGNRDNYSNFEDFFSDFFGGN